MIFGSGRRGSSFFQVAEQEVDVQAALVRSSMMMVSYCISRRSCWISASRIPSVIQLDHGVIAHVVAESHLVTDAAARLVCSSSANTVRHGTRRQIDAAGVAYRTFHSRVPAPCRFSAAGWFSRAGFPATITTRWSRTASKGCPVFLANRQVFRVIAGRAASRSTNFPAACSISFAISLKMACCASGFLTFFTLQTASETAVYRAASGIELLQEHREGQFCCSVIALTGSARPWIKSL